MARPTKNGLDYFPLDVALDDKFELLEAEFGIQGFAVVVKLFQKIYGGQGYYCEWTNEVALLFSRNIGLGCSAVSEIVEASIRRGIFDKKMLNKYMILTSEGLQKRYIDACVRRKQIFMEKRYLLLSVPDLPDNVVINAVNVDINDKNDNINPQSKVKESKVKESKAIIVDDLKEAWQAFAEMRNRIRKPMTNYAAELIIKKLDKLAPNDYAKQKEILLKSVENGWASVYPLNENKAQPQKLQSKPSYDLERIKNDALSNTDIKF